MFAVLFLSSLFPALLFFVRDLIFSFVVSFFFKKIVASFFVVRKNDLQREDLVDLDELLWHACI